MVADYDVFARGRAAMSSDEVDRAIFYYLLACYSTNSNCIDENGFITDKFDRYSCRYIIYAQRKGKSHSNLVGFSRLGCPETFWIREPRDY